jgi:ABC-type Fe3+/spermidine/putrescine transport system ATPase subunit
VADFIGEMNFLQGLVTYASDGEFELDTGAGVVVRGNGNATKGQSAQVGIRPARLRIAPVQPGEEINTARGVAVTKMYLGDEVQVVAELDGGIRMLIREQRAGTDTLHDAVRPGDPITIRWDPSAPVLLSASPAQTDDRGSHE